MIPLGRATVVLVAVPPVVLRAHHTRPFSRRPLGLHCAVTIQKGPPDQAALSAFVYVRRCPTLPHRLRCSTIGAGGLNFRVRNGTGWFTTAMTTETSYGTQTSPGRFDGSGSRSCSGNRIVNARQITTAEPLR